LPVPATLKSSAATRRLVGVAFVLVVACLIAVASPSSASAAMPIYAVMNTSEYPPDGVYFRTAADWAKTDKVTGLGVYAGDRVQLACFAHGTNVPRRDNVTNTVWYVADNVTRPKAPNGQVNSGWINAHFVDDGTGPGQVAPGVAPCDASGRPSPDGGVGSPPVPDPSSPAWVQGASVYYSPFEGDWIRSGRHIPHHVRSVTNETLFVHKWKVDCGNTSRMGDFPDVIDGLPVSTLSGWSAGRQGPIGFLLGYPNRSANIHYIVLYDPGNLEQLQSDDTCFNGQTSVILQRWLSADSRNHLLVMAGRITRDGEHPSTVGGRTYFHRGLQDVYFKDIRGKDTASRVAVCNYDDMSHEDVWMKFQDWSNKAPVTTTCPEVPGVAKANAIWHP
jgi:hypothetical protein